MSSVNCKDQEELIKKENKASKNLSTLTSRKRAVNIMGKLTETHFKTNVIRYMNLPKISSNMAWYLLANLGFCVEKKRKITLLFIHLCIALKKMNEKYT